MAESRSMQIICPHCTTSYAINPATLGAEGRTVRCSRCKEVWLARPEDAVEQASLEPAMAQASRSREDADLAAQWGAAGQDEAGEETPHVASPSIAGDWQDEDQGGSDDDWATRAQNDADAEDVETERRTGLLGKFSSRPAA